MSTAFLTTISNSISAMDKYHHIQILKLLQKFNIQINENTNGVYVNLTELEESVLDELVKYVDYVKLQEKCLNEVEQEKQLIRTRNSAVV